jgi:serine/threonine-protein kinase
MIPAWITARFPDATITPVTAGWSHDQKYRIVTGTDDWLLRVTPLETLPRKRGEFAQLQRIHAASDTFPRAIACETAPNGEDCFVLYSWQPGEDAHAVLPRLPESGHHRLGLEAGRRLRQMHALSQKQADDIHGKLHAKITARRREMQEAGLTFPGYETMVTFLDSHLHLLRHAPTRYLHGDFHLGNMLVTADGQLRIIDFNRSGFGDPIEDMCRLFTFTRETSPVFACGQIAGYFDSPEPPPDFFAHVLCYVLVDCAFGLLWARQFGQKEIDTHFRIVRQIMGDFDGLRTTRPKWFQR